MSRIEPERAGVDVIAQTPGSDPAAVLFDAIRASISIPGIFTPKDIDTRPLVDGGLLNPLPVAPATDHLTDLSIATIRSVTNGVIGVGVIQGVLAGIGFFAMGVSHAGLLAAIVLITSIIQIPALLIIVPIVVWVFSFAAPVPATIFAVYMLFAALSDNVLKPILLGRGVELPAIIVLFGALGGMIAYGIVGLFLGAVILGLGYTIISDWLQAPGDVIDAEPANDS